MSAAPPFERLRLPAYAHELAAEKASGRPINLHAHVGPRAWDRARNRVGGRLVIDLTYEYGPADYDFSVVDELDVLLNADGADILLARAVAIRMCEFGARLVVLVHPSLPKYSEFFYSGEASR